MTGLAIIDRFSRIAPLGLRLRDVATRTVVTEPLDVTATRPNAKAVTLTRNGRGVWVAMRLPGLRDDDLAMDAGSVPLRTYGLAVDDPTGAFLPLRLDLTLPRQGVAQWDGWASLPDAPLAPLRDIAGGVPCPKALPLFSAPARATPIGCAAIRGQLERQDSADAAAWTLLTVEQGGVVRGLTLSDAAGRFALFMAWPEWPRATLPPLSPGPGQPFPPAPATPPAPSWAVTIAAYSSLLPPAQVPTLTQVMAQLTNPRELFEATVAPLERLAPQRLRFGQALTLRTGRTPHGPSSSLVMAAA